MGAQKSLSATTLPYHVFGLTHPRRSCGDPHQAALNDTVTARGRAQCTVDDRIRFIVLLDEGDVSADPDQVSHFPDEVVRVPVRRVRHLVELAVVRLAVVPRLPVVDHDGQCMRMHDPLTSGVRCALPPGDQAQLLPSGGLRTLYSDFAPSIAGAKSELGVRSV